MNIKLLIIAMICCNKVTAQNIFDNTNTKKYIDYLMVSGQYKLAIPELERIVYLDSSDLKMKSNLLKSYRLDNKSQMGFDKIPRLFPDLNNIDSLNAMEVLKLYMDLQKWDEGRQFWNKQPKINKADAAIFDASTYVFSQKLEKAKEVLKLGPDSEIKTAYLGIINKNISKKSSFLAGTLSTLLPGSGRFYAKDWKDGLVSLVFTSSMVLQSYRNFNKHGIRDHRGWIYGAVATGFYVGNIYGSVKSAKNYNLKEINKVQHEVSAIFNARY